MIIFLFFLTWLDIFTAEVIYESQQSNKCIIGIYGLFEFFVLVIVLCHAVGECLLWEDRGAREFGELGFVSLNCWWCLVWLPLKIAMGFWGRAEQKFSQNNSICWPSPIDEQETGNCFKTLASLAKVVDMFYSSLAPTL